MSTCSPSRNSVSPGSMHADLLEHLADDHADVLVVDLHALQAVDLLHLVQQVLLHRARALDPQDVVRVHRALATDGHRRARGRPRARAGACRPATSYSCGSAVSSIGTAGLGRRVGLHEDLALAALDVAEPHDAVDLGDRRRILRLARLEQLGDARQTARDVARLVRLAAELRERRRRRRSAAPSSTVSCAPTGMTKSRTCFSLPPFACQISMCGCSFFSRSSMTTRWRRPVSSSSSSDTDSSSTRSTKRIVPSTSAMIGLEYGSQREDDLILLHLVAVLHHQDRAERHLQARADRRVAVRRRCG